MKIDTTTQAAYNAYMRFAVYRLFCIHSCIALLFLCAAPHGFALPATAHLVVVLVPGLRPNDLDSPELPVLRRIVEEGASGWMVCRSARTTDPNMQTASGRETQSALLLTLGSGARASAPVEVSGLTSKRLHGDTHFKGAVTVAPLYDVKALARANRRLDHNVHVGALGDLLHANGLPTAVMGNLDAGSMNISPVVIMADRNGRVDFAGQRLNTTVPDAESPFGVRTDVSSILRDYDALPTRAGVQLIVCGDLHRWDLYHDYCMPSLALRQHSRCLITFEALLNGLLLRLNKERNRSVNSSLAQLILLAPGPPENSPDKSDRLAPVILWGSRVRAGILTSASTRIPGVVLNTDFLPTAADILGLSLPREMTGRPFTVEPRYSSSASSRNLVERYDVLTARAHLQNVFGGLPTVQAILILIGMVAIHWKPNTRVGAMCGITIVSLPVGFLFLPLLASKNVVFAGLMLTAWAAAAASVAWRFRPGILMQVFYMLCGCIVLALLGDLLSGSHLMRQAWMSYSVTEGARFYGIGNEYMGAMIGAACTIFGLSKAQEIVQSVPAGSGNIRSRARALLPWVALYGSIVIVLGAPTLGAKVGAVPSAGIAFAALLLVAWRGRLRWTDFFGVVVAICVVLGLLALVDAHHAVGGQSHLIRALNGSGGDTLAAIIRRKLALETFLLFHSVWTLLLLAAAGGWWVHFNSKAISNTRDKTVRPRAERAVSSGLFAGAIASLVCNDSGVTAAALILAIGWAWIMVKQ